MATRNLQFLLIIIVPIITTLVTPTVKDWVTHLFKSTKITPAYEGDGILIGDSSRFIPFSSVTWTITQRPMLGDDYHAVSIYAVPEMVARQTLYLYNSSFSTGNRTIRVEKGETRMIGARIFVYLLSSMYLQEDQQTVVNINVDVLGLYSETLPAPVFRFNSFF